MVSVEERMKVLNLLQSGAITPEQAAQLLQAMDSGRSAPASSYVEPPVSSAPGAWDDVPAASAPVEPPEPYTPDVAPYSTAPYAVPQSAPSLPEPPSEPGRHARWLHVRVSDMKTGQPRVNVRLPLSLVGFGLKIGRNFAPEMEGMDIEELARVLQAGEPGPFVDVYDQDDGEHVEVFLE